LTNQANDFWTSLADHYPSNLIKYLLTNDYEHATLIVNQGKPMKRIPILILTASLSTAASTWAAQTDAVQNAPESAQQTAAAADRAESANNQSDADAKFLRMNFREASLDQVLTYLSEAAGFIVNVKPGTSIRGKVTILSNEPLSKDEAVNQLNSVLNANNLAAVENGRTLTIMPRDEAKIAGIPVRHGSDPDKIPITDKIVTQIMPVRFVEAAQLLKDLQPLVSIQTTMTANEAGNAIVMTDTQANIHKVAEIIHDIDMGAEEFTELRVFPLHNSDPTTTADLITQLFADDTSRQGNQGGFSNPFAGGGRFARFAGLAGQNRGNQSSSSNAQNQRIKKRNRVVAVADERTASVVVSATRDLMEQIEDVVDRLDGDQKGKKSVHVFAIQHADPAEALPVLTEMFGKNTTQNSRNNQSQNSALQTRGSSQNNPQTSSSTMSGSRTGLGQGGRTGGGGGTGLSFP
jgi:general secretion pathway protein D